MVKYNVSCACMGSYDDIKTMTNGQEVYIKYADNQQAKEIIRACGKETNYSWSRGCDHLLTIKNSKRSICIRKRVDSIFYPPPDPKPNPPQHILKENEFKGYRIVNSKGPVYVVWESGIDYYGMGYTSQNIFNRSILQKYLKSGDRYYRTITCPLLIIRENDYPICIREYQISDPWYHKLDPPPHFLKDHMMQSNEIHFPGDLGTFECHFSGERGLNERVCEIYFMNISQKDLGSFMFLTPGDRYYDDPRIRGDCNHFIVKENGMKICIHIGKLPNSIKSVNDSIVTPSKQQSNPSSAQISRELQSTSTLPVKQQLTESNPSVTQLSQSSPRIEQATQIPSQQQSPSSPLSFSNPVSVNPSITTSSGSSWSTWLQSATEGSSPTTVIVAGALAATGTYLAYKTYKWFMGKDGKELKNYEKQQKIRPSKTTRKELNSPPASRKIGGSMKQMAREIPSVMNQSNLKKSQNNFSHLQNKGANLSQFSSFPSSLGSFSRQSQQKSNQKPLLGSSGNQSFKW